MPWEASTGIPWDFRGTSTVIPWESLGNPWACTVVLPMSAPTGLSWESHETSVWDFDRSAVGLLWDFYHMGLLWDFCGTSMRLLYGTSMGLLWDFHGISMGLVIFFMNTRQSKV